MREAILRLRSPHRLNVEFRPKIGNCRPLLRGRAAEILPELAIAPLQMAVLAHHEDRLRQAIHRIVHHIINITDNAHTIAFKSPLSVMTTFPCKRSQDGPKQQRCRADVGVIAERHERECQHDDQMDHEIDPRG